jgi:hypothetical protein
MNFDATLGCLLAAGALVLSTLLVVWSRRAIERIARRGFRSAREIEEELNGGG